MQHIDSSSDSMPLTLTFAEISASDLPRVGGKGASLGELSRAGFPVPPGFCVTTAAFDRFMAGHSDLEGFWQALEGLNTRNLATVRLAGEALRGRLLELPMPQEVEAAVLAAWESSGSSHRYAVRSSATAEDLPGASFAGQQDTYLNIGGKEALLSAVRRCWVSLFTDRAIIYRAGNGFSHRQVQLSVVVQRMVMPEASGILFTADPVSGHRQKVVIEAGFGLGEALVSGLVTPDRYVWDRRQPDDLEVTIADKACAINPLPEGGTRQEDLPAHRRRQRVLPESVGLTLARLGQQIEAHYGCPQDIEWCLEGGKLYIVQSRPITSLYPMPEPAPTDGRLHVYACFNHLQMMTRAMPPLALDIWRYALPFGRPPEGDKPNPYMLGVGGRLYLDLTHVLHNPLPQRVIPKIMTVAEPLTASALGSVVAEERFLSGAGKGRLPFRTLFGFFGPFIARGLMWSLVWDLRQVRPYVEGMLKVILERARGNLRAPLPPKDQALAIFTRVWGIFQLPVFRRLASVVFGGVASSRYLDGMLAPLGLEADLEALARGLDGNATTEMDLQVGDLADLVRPYPALGAALAKVKTTSELEPLRALEGGEAFNQAFQGFMDKYGMRAACEIDISQPRYREDPGVILHAILAALSSGQAGAHREKHAAYAAEAEQAAARLVKAARGLPFGWLKARLVDRLSRAVRSCMAMREHPKYMLVRMLDLVREALLTLGDELTAAGRIDARDDIWWLSILQLNQACNQPELELRPWIAKARANHEHYSKLSPPRVFTSEGDVVVGRRKGPALPAGALGGVAASSGVVEGVARVIHDPAREGLLQGEILVAPYTDPGWTPVFNNASAVITEVGGMMTHGSVVARERGIPAVVSVPEATRRIKTGMRLRVNGTLGYVEILAEPPTPPIPQPVTELETGLAEGLPLELVPAT